MQILIRLKRIKCPLFEIHEFPSSRRNGNNFMTYFPILK